MGAIFLFYGGLHCNTYADRRSLYMLCFLFLKKAGKILCGKVDWEGLMKG